MSRSTDYIAMPGAVASNMGSLEHFRGIVWQRHALELKEFRFARR